MPVLVAKESLLHDDETVSIKQPKKTHSGKRTFDGYYNDSKSLW